MKKYIPNTLTSMNVLCGSIAVVITIHDYKLMPVASLFIGIAAVFDFLDGMSARLLKAYSDMGKELDSLADMISFGMAPGAIMFQLIRLSINKDIPLSDFSMLQLIAVFSSMLIVVFSALRLAKFNVDKRQSESFIGLATPANAILIASLPLITEFNAELFLNKWIANSYFLLILTIIQSFLLVSELPMFSLKFKNLKFAQNKIRFIFLSLSLVWIILFKLVSFPFIIITYTILSLVDTMIPKK